MRVIAFLFFCLFISAFTIPVIQSFCDDTKVCLFTPDEEKESEGKKIDKIEEENDKKTEYNSSMLCNSQYLEIHIILPTDRTVKKLPSPFLNKITPPPNGSC